MPECHAGQTKMRWSLDFACGVSVLSLQMSTAKALIAFSFVSTACVFVGLLGCTSLDSSWGDNSQTTLKPTGLPAPKLDAGSTILEVAFVSIVIEKPILDPVSTITETGEVLANGAVETKTKTKTERKSVRGGVEEVWRWIDETAISPEARTTLNLNGLRAGRVHTQSEFERALNAIRRSSRDDAARLLDAAAVGSDISHASQRIPCRMGRRIELPVRQPGSGDISTLVSIGGVTIGRTLNTPQPLFAITLQPNDSSGIRLRMQPEIQYGAMRQTWVGSDSALRIDSRRESWVMDELAFELAVATGGTVVVGASHPSLGLGEQMFTGTTSEGEVDHVLPVVCVAQLPDIMAQ